MTSPTPEPRPEISDEAVTAAAEAMEDAAMRWTGRDLGTIHRDDIAREALAAAVAAGLSTTDRETLDRVRSMCRDALVEQGAVADGAFADPTDLQRAVCAIGATVDALAVIELIDGARGAVAGKDGNE